MEVSTANVVSGQEVVLSPPKNTWTASPYHSWLMFQHLLVQRNTYKYTQPYSMPLRNMSPADAAQGTLLTPFTNTQSFGLLPLSMAIYVLPRKLQSV